MTAAPVARPVSAGELKALATAGEPALKPKQREFLRNLGAGVGIATILGFAENYGHTANLAPGLRLPFSESMPNAVFDRLVTRPLSRFVSRHPVLQKLPLLESWPYWSLLVIGPSLIPILYSAYQAHQNGESLKPYLKDAAVQGFAALAVQDAAYWLANPAFGGARALLGREYWSAIPQDRWLEALPVVGRILGQNLPGLNIPVAYVVAAGVVGGTIAYRLLKARTASG